MTDAIICSPTATETNLVNQALDMITHKKLCLVFALGLISLILTTTAKVPLGNYYDNEPFGRCPIPKICLTYCDRDECAKKDQMCCCRGCGFVCTTPIFFLGRNICPPDPLACRNDYDCSGGKMCCQDGCTTRCISP